MGNSNSSSSLSAVSTPKTPKSSATFNASVRRRSTAKSVRLSGKPPPPKTLIKTSLSNQPSLNVDGSPLNNGNVSPTEFESNGNINIRTSKSMYELRNKQSPTSPAPSLSTQNGSFRRSPTANSATSPLIMNGYNEMNNGVENE